MRPCAYVLWNTCSTLFCCRLMGETGLLISRRALLARVAVRLLSRLVRGAAAESTARPRARGALLVRAPRGRHSALHARAGLSAKWPPCGSHT